MTKLVLKLAQGQPVFSNNLLGIFVFVSHQTLCQITCGMIKYSWSIFLSYSIIKIHFDYVVRRKG